MRTRRVVKKRHRARNEEVRAADRRRFVRFSAMLRVDYPAAGRNTFSYSANLNTTGVFLRDRDTDSNGIFDEPGHVGTSPVSVGLYRTDSAQLDNAACAMSSGWPARRIG